MLILAALLFLYLFSEGISFRRSLDLIKSSVRVDTHPMSIETIVESPQPVATVIENNSDMNLRVLRLGLNFPTEVQEDAPDLKLLVQAHKRQSIVTVLGTKVAGRFDTQESTLDLGGRLFKQAIRFSNSVSILARPLIVKAGPLVETSGLLSVDPLRLGHGTDFARLRTWTLADDYRAIDWKATARTGNLMSVDFYLERDPTIMLLVDASSSMRARRGDGSMFSIVVGEIAGFLASRLGSSAVGLVMHDEKNIVAKIEPRPGLKNREIILRTLLERAGPVPAMSTLQPQASQVRTVLTNGDRIRETERSFPSNTKPFGEHSSSFAGLVLPFFRKSMSRRVSRLRTAGVFKAFEIIRDVPDPSLVIAISDGKTSWVGLGEGARYAAMLGHWVIVVILCWPQDGMSDRLSELDSRVRAVQCVPEDLWRAINAEILAASRVRVVRESP